MANEYVGVDQLQLMPSELRSKIITLPLSISLTNRYLNESQFSGTYELLGGHTAVFMMRGPHIIRMDKGNMRSG